jgi:hypothetical protein
LDGASHSSVSVERARVEFAAFTICPHLLTVPLTPHSQLFQLESSFSGWMKYWMDPSNAG